MRNSTCMYKAYPSGGVYLLNHLGEAMELIGNINTKADYDTAEWHNDLAAFIANNRERFLELMEV